MTTRTSAQIVHQHMPPPTSEWTLQGTCDLVLPHLTLIAHRIVWQDEHFAVCARSTTDADQPEDFRVLLGNSPVGAINFLPLPGDRTLMRFYSCSDLGDTCTHSHGNAAAVGFFGVLLTRLEHLEFLVLDPETSPARALGFHTPESTSS